MKQVHEIQALPKGSQEIPQGLALQKFIAALDLLSEANFPLDAVNKFLTTTPLSQDALEPYAFFSKQRYTRNLLFKRPTYEILLLCWTAGQASPIHGHEGEKCWMRVEQGELLFINYNVKEIAGKCTIEPKHQVSGSKGFVDGPAVVHRVENLTLEPAMSLHLYARPFAQCDIFDKEHQIKQKISLKYDSAHGKLLNFSLALE